MNLRRFREDTMSYELNKGQKNFELLIINYLMEPQNPNYRAAVEGIVDGAPFIQYLGIELHDVGPGWCETFIELKKHHLQQDNFIHAGVLATLAGYTAGMASLTLVPEKDSDI